MYGLDPQTNEFFNDLFEGGLQACSRDMYRDLLNQIMYMDRLPFRCSLTNKKYLIKRLRNLLTLERALM